MSWWFFNRGTECGNRVWERRNQGKRENRPFEYLEAYREEEQEKSWINITKSEA